MHMSVVTLHVDDVDRAIEFYTKTLGWDKTMDATMGGGSRCVTVAPPGAQTAFFLSTEFPKSNGLSGVIMEVVDVYRSYDQLRKSGVEFTDCPRSEPWGASAMFKDSEGNVHELHSPAVVSAGTN
jgi:lactoylglutathione lyase